VAVLSIFFGTRRASFCSHSSKHARFLYAPQLSRVTGLRETLSPAAPIISLQSREELLKENGVLTAALEEQKALALDRTQLEKENTELRAVLGRFDQEKLIVASVLSRQTALRMTHSSSTQGKMKE